MLEVSLETSDKGRGMNSIVSEKPTRALLETRWGGESVNSEVSGDSLTSCDAAADSKFGCLSSALRKFEVWLSLPDGVVGALPPIGIVLMGGGLIIMEMSWQEMAADLR